MTEVLAREQAPGAGRPGAVAEVRDLHVSLRTADGVVQALRGVDLTVGQGEIVALVGESGSGKSVLGACLLGQPPRSARTSVSGTVEVAGVDMLGSPAKVTAAVRRQLLGAVFQDPLSSLDPTMRIVRQLRERGADEARAVRALGDSGVPQPERRLRQWPHELSGGLRQRVSLAAALAADERGSAGSAVLRRIGALAAQRKGTPLLLLADEPTTALDVSVQAQVVALFSRLREEHGCAILLITHDLGVAASVADRIAVLYAGRVCEVGPARELLQHPRHPYTLGLLQARLSVDTDVVPVAIGGSAPSPLAPPSGCAFAPRCPCAQDDCTATLPGVGPVVVGHGLACLHPLPADALSEAQSAARPAVDVGAPRVRTGSRAQPTAVAPIARPALQLNDVAKSFPSGRGRAERLHAVVDVSLEVPAGGAVALVGESGCGKSTLLRIATGLTRPDSGDVVLGGAAGSAQLVFQDAGSSLTPWLSIGGQIRERLGAAGIPRSERADRTADLLQRVGLDDRAARSRPQQLSGGQRQRAAIARALASQPSLLVCDEPVSALDASLVVRVLDLLQELRDSLGVALLVVTHDLAAARRIGEQTAVMYLGRIVESGPTDVVFSAPRHPYTQGLLDATPTTEPGRLAPTLRGEPPTPYGLAPGCAFAPRCAHRVQECDVRPLLTVAPAQSAHLVACHVRPLRRTPPAGPDAPAPTPPRSQESTHGT